MPNGCEPVMRRCPFGTKRSAQLGRIRCSDLVTDPVTGIDAQDLADQMASGAENSAFLADHLGALCMFARPNWCTLPAYG